MADRILACHLVIWLYLWLYFKLLLSFSVFYFLMGIFYILLLLNSIFQSQLKHCFSFPASCLYSDLTPSLHCLLEYQKFGKNYDRGFWNTFPPSVLPFTACNDGQKIQPIWLQNPPLWNVPRTTPRHPYHPQYCSTLDTSDPFPIQYLLWPQFSGYQLPWFG